MTAPVSILIPTFNNNQYLAPCVASILNPLSTEDLFHIYIVNNGEKYHMEPFKDHPRITILQQSSNRGWEGGLKSGLEASTEEFVIFMNDDTYVPLPSCLWINQMINHFGNPRVGAVGPSSNVVMGAQNIFTMPHSDVFRVNFLIGFCMMVKRKALEDAGGIDLGLPGGDDLDLSIRLRKSGYDLIADKNVFIYHHGFKTGERVNGGSDVIGGWNSIQMLERTNHALIQKHGLREYLHCMKQIPDVKSSILVNWSEIDTEAEVVRKYVIGEKVVEIGCGMKKTVPYAIGVDRIPYGKQVNGVKMGFVSLADVLGDAEGSIPLETGSFDTGIARHVLEHVVDPVVAIKEWGRLIRPNGRLIIAVPDHTFRNTIPMNKEHVHAWTPKSLNNFMESQGWKTVDLIDPKNHVSFVGIFERN